MSAVQFFSVTVYIYILAWYVSCMFGLILPVVGWFLLNVIFKVWQLTTTTALFGMWLIFLYSTELLCLNLKTNLSNTVACNAVWQCYCVKPMRIGLIKTLRKTKQKQKNKQSCVVYRDTFPTYTRKTSAPWGKKSHTRYDVKNRRCRWG